MQRSRTAGRRPSRLPAGLLAALLGAGLVLPNGGGAEEAGSAPSACCASLQEVRANIDRIDAALIALMAERAGYVAAAARFKPDAARVHDAQRVEQIIARVRTLAQERALPPDVAEATFRAMIAAFTEYEKTLVRP